jgi:aminoglycoside phosphotransferase (APT) family kinase protein
VIKNHQIPALIRARIGEAWPGTTLAEPPTPLAGGFWAAMYRLRLEGQPAPVPSDVVFRIAPDAAMGAKELVVQRTVADLGYPTPHVRLSGPADVELGGTWSVMDFAAGSPPLGDLNGLAAIRRAPRLFGRLPQQLAAPMARLHDLDPEPVTSAVDAAAPSVAWSVGALLEHFETAADGLGRGDLTSAIRILISRRPAEGVTVVCHGDLHPFNLLVRDGGDITVIDWTAAIRADPAYDVAFTAMLVANPPLHAPGPLGSIIRRIGAALARRFIVRYQDLAPHHDLSALDWYRALHSARILIEAASIEARSGSTEGHPFGALLPAATAALRNATGTPLAIET